MNKTSKYLPLWAVFYISITQVLPFVLFWSRSTNDFLNQTITNVSIIISVPICVGLATILCCILLIWLKLLPFKSINFVVPFALLFNIIILTSLSSLHLTWRLLIAFATTVIMSISMNLLTARIDFGLYISQKNKLKKFKENK